MLSEQPHLCNVALIADNYRMYQTVSVPGDPNAEQPHISASAHIQPDGEGNCNSGERRSNRSALSFLGKAMLECVANTWANIPEHRRCRLRFSESLSHKLSNFHRRTVKVRA
jgi:hypothetical protein